MLTVDNFNVEPNEKWFVRLSAGATNIDISLYLSRANALAGTNPIASGQSSGFGTFRPVTLTQIATTPAISKFATNVSWDLQVSGQTGDSMEIYRVGPFSDMDDVSHAIYRNDEIIPYRAAALVNERTHLDRSATIVTPKIDSQITPNKSLRVASSEMGIDAHYTISGIELELTPDSMLMTVTASKYERMLR